MRYDVTTFAILDNYEIFVELESGVSGIFDMKPYLDTGVFRELKDKHYFAQVRIEFGALTWPHEQDIAPERLAAELRRESFHPQTIEAL